MEQLLVKLGWSQAYFARHMGVCEKTVSRWVRGDAPPWAMRYLNLCVRLLNV